MSEAKNPPLPTGTATNEPQVGVVSGGSEEILPPPPTPDQGDEEEVVHPEKEGEPLTVRLGPDEVTVRQRGSRKPPMPPKPPSPPPLPQGEEVPNPAPEPASAATAQPQLKVEEPVSERETLLAEEIPSEKNSSANRHGDGGQTFAAAKPPAPEEGDRVMGESNRAPSGASGWGWVPTLVGVVALIAAVGVVFFFFGGGWWKTTPVPPTPIAVVSATAPAPSATTIVDICCGGPGCKQYPPTKPAPRRTGGGAPNPQTQPITTATPQGAPVVVVVPVDPTDWIDRAAEEAATN